MKPRPRKRLLDRICPLGLSQAWPQIALGVGLWMAGAALTVAQAGQRPVELQSFATHSRLTVRLDENVRAVWKEKADGFEVLFPGVALSDLGAPLGAEAEWAEQARKLSDQRLGEIHLGETEKGLVLKGKWRFPEGKARLAFPKMEHFDYRDSKAGESRYVLDFWVKPGMTAAELQARKHREAREVELQNQKKIAKAREERRLAYQRARAEIEEVTRFCQEPVVPGRDIFLNFLPLHEEIDLKKYFPTKAPDENFSYFEPKSDSKEAQYLRLAQHLYRTGDFGLVSRTVEFFEKEVKASAYQEEMRFLRANAFFKLGHEEEALKNIRELAATRPQTPMALQGMLFMAQRSFHKGLYLEALEHFLWLSNRYPKHQLNWVFQLGAAECSFRLLQTERASKAYSWIAGNAATDSQKAEGAFRAGDLFVGRQQYEQAVASYYDAFQRFPSESMRFPSAWLNRAESLYWLGQLDRAEQAFQEFLDKFPAHSAGWRASFRIAEIWGRRSGPEAVTKSRKWYLDTINRFPFSPGETLARARLIPCADHAGFDLATADRFFTDEAPKGSYEADLIPAKVREFLGLQHLRALITLGGTDRAIDVAILDLIKNPRSEAKGFVSDVLRALFRRSILEKLDSGRIFEALTFYQEKVDLIPKAREGSSPIDADYLLRLSRAASELGLGSLALKLNLAHAKEAGPSHLAMRGPAGEEPAANPGSQDPESREMEENLRASERHFTEARALWTAQGLESKEAIRKHLSEVAEESEYSFEKEVILALMDEREKKLASALQHAVKAELLLGAREAPPRFQGWIAQLHAQAGDARAAATYLGNLVKSQANRKPAGGKAQDAAVGATLGKIDEQLLSGLGVPPLMNLESMLFLQGEQYGRAGLWGESAAAFAQASDAGLGGNRALYEWSRSLRKQEGEGASAKADEVLRKLASSATDDFWRKLAREALGDTKKP